MNKRRFEPGEVLSFISLCHHIVKRKPMYFHHKFTTFGWYQNWTLHYLLQCLGRGELRRVKEIDNARS